MLVQVVVAAEAGRVGTELGVVERVDERLATESFVGETVLGEIEIRAELLGVISSEDTVNAELLDESVRTSIIEEIGDFALNVGSSEPESDVLEHNLFGFTLARRTETPQGVGGDGDELGRVRDWSGAEQGFIDRHRVQHAQILERRSGGHGSSGLGVHEELHDRSRVEERLDKHTWPLDNVQRTQSK